MNAFQAIVLGVVQGLTEFLPISSTAHIRIVPALVGWDDPGAAFTAVIQLGTLLAVLIYFWRDLGGAAAAWFRGLRGGPASQTPECRLAWAAIIGTFPIAILGLLFAEHIRGELRSLWVISGALVLLALVLLAAERFASHRRDMSSVRVVDGLIVGLWQALALIPGVSRSGSTITGALFLGFTRPAAARLSFLLSMPAIFLAGVHELIDQRAELLSAGLVPVGLATLAAFVSGYASIDFLMKFLRTHTTGVFIAYRVVLGLALIGLILGGVLDPLR